MAERLFLHVLQSENDPLKALKATSAGVSAFDGTPPSTNSIKALQDCDISLNGHKSQLLTQETIDKSIALFCMTHTHCDIIKSEFDLKNKPVHLMREFLENAQDLDIPDPFGQNLAAYQACRDSMVEAIPSIIKFLEKEVLA